MASLFVNLETRKMLCDEQSPLFCTLHASWRMYTSSNCGRPSASTYSDRLLLHGSGEALVATCYLVLYTA
jgi:hypothetical protein